jgi:WD40 repeat protein
MPAFRITLITVVGFPAVTGLVLAMYLFPPKTHPHPVGPLDQLDPRNLPQAARPSDPPPELVAVLGLPTAPPTEYLCSVAVSSDGRYLAGGTRCGEVWLWEVPSLRRLWRRSAHVGTVTALAFSADGRNIASGSRDGSVRRWSLSGEPLGDDWPVHTSLVSALVFSPDGQTLATAAEGFVSIWDISQDRPMLSRQLDVASCPVHALALSPDGHWLAAAGGGDNMIRLWGLDRRRPEPDNILPGGGEFRVRALAFTRDGSAIASIDSDGLGILWDAKGPPIRSWRVFCPPFLGAAFAADGRHLITVHGDGTAWVLRPVGGWEGQ